MKIIIILALFLIVIIDGKPTSDWSVSSDSTMIEECLRKSLKKIDAAEDIRTALKETTNVVCHTKVNNGINIKLIFDFRDQRWECSLYKSFVDTLDVQYENCMKVAKTSKSLEDSQTNNNNNEEVEEDDEAKIDEMNQEMKDKDQEEQPEDSEVEEDDEAKADEVDQEVKDTDPKDQLKDSEVEEDDKNVQTGDDDDDDDPNEPEEDKNFERNGLGLGGLNQNNLGLGGSDQNTDSDEDNNQNLQGRQSNVGLDQQEGAMTNVGNQDEDEADSNEIQLNSKAYEQVEADEYSDKRYNFAGKNHDEAKDNDGDDISDDA